MPGSGSSVPARGIGRALAIALALAIIGVATSTEGHHGIVNFDLNKDITIKGVIKRLAFVNPHADLEPTRPGKSIGHWGRRAGGRHDRIQAGRALGGFGSDA